MRTLNKIVITLGLLFLAGCAGTNTGSSSRRDYVEVANPAFTMSPNAPETIWVPRSYVDSGVPRGGELAKQGYEAIKGSTPVPAGETGIVAPGGKPAALIPRFGMVVAVDKDKVYFNLGREAGINIGQKLKVFRGGTVVEGLGLAPGEAVGTIEVLGFVGSKGGYGVMKQGGPAQMNDLVGGD
ncbi:lipoprotein, putative [Geotalea daltonii FRC-32]|uniref:Lipoprotein, putative n=1 Tax=Geotalea daltonii (strain DSM 22248 / JCM 15807 / FRC-32) TaxID=316067 RepID=B9M8N7_GEODF|nr:hypothetical protein [Geotalea daltonii]ACM18572.1 lipoprotein, putative [Geotalea daltonii FRC-32]